MFAEDYRLGCKGRPFHKMSKKPVTKKAKFTKLLKHNEFDVMALVHLFDEIQSSDPHLIENATRPISELVHNRGSLNDE